MSKKNPRNALGRHSLSSAARIAFKASTAIGVFAAITSVMADPLPVSGPTLPIPNDCMQKAFGTPVSSSNQLNCTANDIRLSKAIRVSPTTCIAGTYFDLYATFQTDVTANARYDAGFFFRLDGGPNARGDGVNASGACSISALDNPPNSASPALNLDGDKSGDLNSGSYETTFKIPHVYCQAAPNTNQLKLPNCTSWHSNSGTYSEPTASRYFKPDTKSKCACDDNFTVPVTVQAATVTVTKSVTPVTLPETGGTATFTVTIANSASVADLGITNVRDSVDGTATAVDITTLDALSDCGKFTVSGYKLAPGASDSCTFSLFVSGAAGTQLTDRVDVNGYTVSTGASLPTVSATATVNFSEVFVAPTLSKTVFSTACQVDATYNVQVNNNASNRTLTISGLTDNKFGDITVAHTAGGGFEQVVSTTCNNLPYIVPVSDAYKCSFVGRIANGSCNVSHTNTITGNTASSYGTAYAPTGSATVTVSTP